MLNTVTWTCIPPTHLLTSPPPTFPSGFELSKGKLQAETIKLILERLPVELLPFCGTQGKEYAKAQT
jgi:hypothetical protein